MTKKEFAIFILKSPHINLRSISRGMYKDVKSVDSARKRLKERIDRGIIGEIEVDHVIKEFKSLYEHQNNLG